MKRLFYFIALITFILILGGCSSISYFYQVYDTSLPNNVKMVNSNLYYEDDNCKIIYDLWGDRGEIGFSFYNKSDRNLYLNLEESFFIKNGVAYDYYQNRIFQTSKTSSSSVTDAATVINFGIAESQSLNSSQSNAYSEYKAEQKIICIPPKTLKCISEYKIADALYRSCNIYRYPNKRPSAKYINKEEFDQTNTPLEFGNIITYSFKSNTDDYVRVNNTFTVNSIANYREKDINRVKKMKYCDEGYSSSIVFTDTISAPNKFYIKYTKNKKDQDTFKH